MVEITFTYEDGLRLSELYGELAKQNVVLDNLWTEALPWLIIVGLVATILVGAIAIFIWVCIWSCIVEKYDAPDTVVIVGYVVCVAITIGIVIVCEMVTYNAVEIGIQGDIASLQAQIDALELKRELTMGS